MNYHEHAPTASLAGLVKSLWSLDAEAEADRWIEHRATPDGCVEVIARIQGRSRWNGDQPECFAVGLSEEPISFEISGDARFAAVRLWPWTWQAISGLRPEYSHGRWIDVGRDGLSQLLDVVNQLDSVEAIILEMLGPRSEELKRIGSAVIQAQSVAEMGTRAEMPPRKLQRWFARYVGLSPRRYLRVLRFQNAFEHLPNAIVLARHAAEHGYADQAHMAREFRRLAGEAASRAKPRTRGPFLT